VTGSDNDEYVHLDHTRRQRCAGGPDWLAGAISDCLLNYLQLISYDRIRTVGVVGLNFLQHLHLLSIIVRVQYFFSQCFTELRYVVTPAPYSDRALSTVCLSVCLTCTGTYRFAVTYSE